jgi:hypothetical protein
MNMNTKTKWKDLFGWIRNRPDKLILEEEEEEEDKKKNITTTLA